jgi:hypothetical protein
MVIVAVAAALVLAGGALVALAIRQRRRAVVPDEWPSTWGVIRTASVVETRTSGGRGDPSYEALVEYDYEVGNRTRQSSRIMTGTLGPQSWSAAISMAHRFFPGGVALVRYDPDHPEFAVLMTHARCAGVAAGALGFFTLCAGTMTALLALPMARP